MSGPGRKDACRTLANFALPSEPGNERKAMEMVVEGVNLHLSLARLQKVKTAVAGATMNAMEHGNHYRPETLVAVRVLASAGNFCVRSTDRGVGPIPAPGAEAQALKDRLEGRESLRDWGLSLIRNMVDEVNETICEDHLRADPAPERRRPCQRIGLTSVRHRSGAAVIDLYGVIDGFAEEALAAYDEAQKRDPDIVLVNYGAWGTSTPRGIALIWGLLAKARTSNRRMLACGLSKHYAENYHTPGRRHRHLQQKHELRANG